MNDMDELYERLDEENSEFMSKALSLTPEEQEEQESNRKADEGRHRCSKCLGRVKQHEEWPHEYCVDCFGCELAEVRLVPDGTLWVT